MRSEVQRGQLGWEWEWGWGGVEVGNLGGAAPCRSGVPDTHRERQRVDGVVGVGARQRAEERGADPDEPNEEE